MRLINTLTLEFKEFLGPATPPYAILSHTWEEDEVSLQEMTLQLPSLSSKKGYRKVIDYCRLAARDGFYWAWVDTCCIDKTNHAELAESINSMFRWYQEAAVCHVFLSDLPPYTELETALPYCRWFTRGWTLQELIAPSMVEFYDQAWMKRGTKSSLIGQLETITGILGPVLDGSMCLADVSVGVRMSWAAYRSTTRPEDVAYSLLGIFDVNIPMIYGEGQKAFRRLQEEIIRQSNDLTIFAWQHESDGRPLGGSSPLLATSPGDFALHSTRRSRDLLRTLRPEHGWKWSETNPEYAITNKGLRITTFLVLEHLIRVVSAESPVSPKGPLYVLSLGEVKARAEATHGEIIGVVLDKVAPDLFLRRRGPLHVMPFSWRTFPILTPSLSIYIAMNEHSFYSDRELVSQGTIPVAGGRVPIRSEGISRGSAQPSHAVVRVDGGIPEMYWDHTNRRFFGAHRHPTVLALSAVVTLPQGTVNVICLINAQENWATYLFRPSDHPALARWFGSSKAIRESTSSEELPDGCLWRRPGLGPPSSLDVVVGGVSYSLIARGPGPPKSSDDTWRWEVTFEITRHSAVVDA
jgi:hypothetical protein